MSFSTTHASKTNIEKKMIRNGQNRIKLEMKLYLALQLNIEKIYTLNNTNHINNHQKISPSELFKQTASILSNTFTSFVDTPGFLDLDNTTFRKRHVAALKCGSPHIQSPLRNDTSVWPSLASLSPPLCRRHHSKTLYPRETLMLQEINLHLSILLDF